MKLRNVLPWLLAVACAAALLVIVVYVDRKVGLWAGLLIALFVAGPFGVLMGRATRRGPRRG